jgi:hypothetical protein
VTSKQNEDQEMLNQSKYINIFNKVNDNYTITNCNNGFIIEVSGQDFHDEWINAKFVVITVDELKNDVQELSGMLRT